MEEDNNESLGWDQTSDRIKILETLLLAVSDALYRKGIASDDGENPDGLAHDFLNAIHVRIKHDVSKSEQESMNNWMQYVNSCKHKQSYHLALVQYEDFMHCIIRRNNIIPIKKELKKIPVWRFGF